MKTKMIGLLLLVVLFATCAQKEKTDECLLVGKLILDDVYRTCPRFRQVAEQYEANKDVVQRLKEIDRPITCNVFLGTWCSDSEEHVPPFEELLEAANNPNISVAYYGVDRKKDDGIGLAQKYNIHYVPTFVFLEKGLEIGRIVETPTVSIGEDVLNILEGKE